MPRFSVSFAKRKSNTDETGKVDVTPPAQSSFRVLERDDLTTPKPLDGGARMAKASTALLPKPDFHNEDNMFADMKTHSRGLSNASHITYTDNSSRHSNASTAPSSADFSGGHVHDENRTASSKTSSPETSVRGTPSKSIGSKFLDKAGRTFSFGGQKKHTISAPKDEFVPDMPPLLTLSQEQQQQQQHHQRQQHRRNMSRGSTAKMEADPIDMGSDFGSMMPSFDKRASMATVRMDDLAHPRVLTGNRLAQSGQPVPPSPDTANPADPLLNPWNTPKSHADQYVTSTGSSYDRPPPVPPHQSRSTARRIPRQAEVMSEEDDEEESYGSVNLLPSQEDYARGPQSARFRREDDSVAMTPRKQPTSKYPERGDSEDDDDDDNLFEGSSTRLPRPSYRYATPKAADPPRNKVMTPAEFEKYREDKIRQDTVNKANKIASGDGDDDEDEEEINYDDEEDEAEKSKQQAKQRRKQEAHMAVYRQQMMKVTGETNPPASPAGRTGLPSSVSAPQLSQMKGPSPLPTSVSDDDEDENIPLAFLQAHGFPNKNRPPTRLSNMGSNPNMRASMHSTTIGRPSSIVGDPAASRRHSTLPAFARNLPQDPFFGASIAKPALRESLLFSEAAHMQKPPSPLPPGGLVGVIANEERSRAMRRGSPSVDATKLMGAGFVGGHGQGIDPVAGIPHHMMYNQHSMGGGGGMQGVMPPHMMQQQQHLQQHQQYQPQQQQQPMGTGDQNQFQMNQMSQLMQMQMQFMQMMTANQGGGGGMPQQRQFGGMGPSGSMMDLSSARNSFAAGQGLDARRADYNMRTMSMVQPSSAPMVHPGYAGSVRSSVHGYTPSIAPSERSNVGLPNRYRPVSQAAGAIKSHSISGILSIGDGKGKTAMRVVNKSASTSDDDDEEGWEAMKNKRDKKRSMWKSKKSFSSVI